MADKERTAHERPLRDRRRMTVSSVLRRVATVLLLGLVVCVDLTSATRSHAAGSMVQTENVRAELVADVTSVSPGASFWVALQLDIRDGWHTYWRNPGDSGEPTRLSWTLPEGVTASEINWPYPERIPYGPLVNFGYENRALHLVRIAVPDNWPPGKALEAKADASWLVCKDICIPEFASLELTLPTVEGPAEVNKVAAAEVGTAVARLPTQSPSPAIFSVDQETLILDVATGARNANIESVNFFPYEWGAVEPAGNQQLDVGDDRLILKLVSAGTVTDVLDGVLVITERSGGAKLKRAIEISATRGADAAIPTAGSLTSTVFGEGGGASGDGVSGIARAMFLAFLGGLILNLMPCVFPVLSIKAIGIVKYAASSPRALRFSGLAYAAGVVAFMAVVGGILVALKSAGAEIGWGFQLQSPVFVSVMAIVLFSLGLSLSGYFTFGASVMGWGSGLAERSDGKGSFFTGALAALVATPCTAPFMGAAIGYALAQPWAVAVAVMLFLGMGLAFPYLLLTWIPGLANRLPRPGAWMDRLKQLLAFPLYAAAAWLVWVLSIQAGPQGVLAVLMAMILVAFAIWLLRATREVGPKGRVCGSVATVIAVVVAIGLSFVPQVSIPAASNDLGAAKTEGLGPAEPFSVARLDALRAAGTPVFVNITAAWCITCKVNEQVALSSGRVARDFADRGIVYLKGDWTSRDAEISRYLSWYGRGGVPLYVLYKSDTEQPLVLPQILTESIVIEALEDLPRAPDYGQLRDGDDEDAASDQT